MLDLNAVLVVSTGPASCGFTKRNRADRSTEKVLHVC